MDEVERSYLDGRTYQDREVRKRALELAHDSEYRELSAQDRIELAERFAAMIFGRKDGAQ